MKRPAFYLSRTQTLLSAGTVVLALGVAAAPAGAASVSVSGGTIAYTTAPDETNNLTVAPWGLAVKVTDSGTKGKRQSAITVIAGSGCYQLSSNAAACSGTATQLNATLGDRDDAFDASLATLGTTVSGGPGNDVLHGGFGVDALEGGAGDDSFDTRDAAADAIVCGDGADSGNADAPDSLSTDCESVARPQPPITDPGLGPVSPVTDPLPDPGTDPGTTGDGGTDDPPDGSDGPGDDIRVTPAANAVPASIPPQTVGVSASGVARVQIVCPPDSGGCSGTVTIELPAASTKQRGKISVIRKRAPLKLGRAKFKAAAGTAPVVPVRLSKRGRQRIVRGRRSRARIVVSTRKADGTTTVTSQSVTITVKRPATKRRARRP
jgi:hypothetical protein